MNSIEENKTTNNKEVISECPIKDNKEKFAITNSFINPTIPKTYKLYTPQPRKTNTLLFNKLAERGQSIIAQNQSQIIPPIIPKKENDLNIEELQNRIRQNELQNERYEQKFFEYISQKRSEKRIQMQNMLEFNNFRKPQKICSNNYFPKDDNNGIGKLHLSRGADFSFNYIENEKGEPVKLSPIQSQEERQKTYFHRKKIMDMDFNGKNYLEYLQGKIDKIEPNPYNRHIDYLGESKLVYNSISSPVSNKLGNKLIFGGKKIFQQQLPNQFNKYPYGLEYYN